MKKLLAVFAAISVLSIPIASFASSSPDDLMSVHDGTLDGGTNAHLVDGIWYDTNARTLSVSGASIMSITGLQSELDSKATSSRTFNYSTRSLNTCFQPSSTKDAQVSYAVDIATVSTLASGQAGTVYLETYTDSGCTTGTQEIARFMNGNTQSLGLTVTMNQNVTGNLSGVIPAGKYVKLRTQNNIGSPTFTSRPSQEVLL